MMPTHSCRLPTESRAIQRYWVTFLVITSLVTGLLAVQTTHKLHWQWGVVVVITGTLGGIGFGYLAQPR